MTDQGPFDITPHRGLYPFRSNFLDIKGLKYHYLDEGSGTPVVMLHGNPTWSFYFRKLVKDLGPEHRTIVPDHMGCGLSDRPTDRQYDFRLKSRIDDLEMLLQHLGIKEKITLILHDWGGAVGLGWAVRHPDQVGRLVILNTAGFFPPRAKGLPWRLWLIRNARAFAAPAVLRFNLFAAAALFMASARGLTPEVKAGLIAPYNTPQNRLATLRFVQDIPLKPGDPGYDLIEGISRNLDQFRDRPVLICWGGKDFVFDEWYFSEWRRRFPEAEAHLFPQAGHYVLEDEGQEISRLVQNFLKRRPL
ncbi:MAG: alpha/beta fold hydrolase [Pseudomonadota bacterium]